MELEGVSGTTRAEEREHCLQGGLRERDLPGVIQPAGTGRSGIGGEVTHS